MNNELVKKFIEMSVSTFDNTKISNLNAGNLYNTLDSIYSQWSFEVEKFDNENVLLTLYLPGKVLQSIGKDIDSIIINIINKFNNNTHSDNQNNINTQTTQQDNSKIMTPQDVVNKLDDMKSNITNKTQESNNINSNANKVDELFNGLLNTNLQQATQNNNQQINNNQNNTQQNTQPKSEVIDYGEVDFFSKEAEAFTMQMHGEMQQSQFKPTPEFINPNNEVMTSKWTQQDGQKFNAWCKESGVTNQQQADKWFQAFCGLDAAHFDPQYLDNFIEWFKQMREKQTY